MKQLAAVLCLLFVGCSTLQKAFKYEADRHIKKVTVAELEPLIDKKLDEKLDQQLEKAVEEKIGATIVRGIPWLLGGGGGLFGMWGISKYKNGRRKTNGTNNVGNIP